MRDDTAVPEHHSDTAPRPGDGLLTFARVPSDEPPASDLIEAMIAEVSELYGARIDAPGKPTATAQELLPPNGACVVGLLDGDPVAVGAVKRLEDGLCEIKRMYVVPRARSRGVARALLIALEDAARDLGYQRVRLDTGRSQHHAKALYESYGYREIPDYNGNPFASFWGEKELWERTKRPRSGMPRTL